MNEDQRQKNGRTVAVPSAIFILVVGAIILLGWLGYRFVFLGTVENIIMPVRFEILPLVLLSMVLGIAAFLSPCAFTVLPAYVAHLLTAGEAKKLSRGETLLKAAALGLAGAAGIILVNMVIGLLIAALGAAAPFAKDPREDAAIILGIRVAAGLLIAGLGILTLVGKGVGLGWIHRITAGKRFSRSVLLYGILYNGAAIGCTGPIMLALMLYALANASFLGALLAFAVFSLTMGALMVILTMLAATIKQSLVPFLTAAAPLVKKIAAGIMVVVGLAITLLTLEGNRLFVRLFFPFLPA